MKKIIFSLSFSFCSVLAIHAQSEVIYDTTHSSTNGTEISGVANGPQTNYGDAIQYAGTNRFLDNIEVDLFNINDATPFDLTMSLYTDCPTVAGTATCGSGVGTLIPGSVITISVTPPDIVGTLFTAQFPFNNLDLSSETDNTITVMINASREDVFWTINEVPVVGSLPAGDTPLSTLTRCGSTGTNNGCTRAFASPTNNNLGMKITANANLSVNDFVSRKFVVSPNPANNIIKVTNSENIAVTAIVLTDLNGRVVKSSTYSDISNIQINVSDLAAGIYMMKITSDQGTATKKIIKN